MSLWKCTCHHYIVCPADFTVYSTKLLLVIWQCNSWADVVKGFRNSSICLVTFFLNKTPIDFESFNSVIYQYQHQPQNFRRLHKFLKINIKQKNYRWVSQAVVNCKLNSLIPPSSILSVDRYVRQKSCGPPTLPAKLACSFYELNYSSGSMYICLRCCREQQTNQAPHAQSSTSILSLIPWTHASLG